MTNFVCSDCGAKLHAGFDCEACGSFSAEPEEYVKAEEGKAHFSYELNAASGYEQTGTVHNIKPETFGEVMRVLSVDDPHAELRRLVAVAEKEPGASMDGDLCDALADARALLAKAPAASTGGAA